MSLRSLVKPLPACLLLLATACSGAAGDGGIGIARGFNVIPVSVADRERAPAFDGPSLRDGAPITSAALLGSVVVLNFWGSWCGPCRREQPLLEALSKEYAPRGARFVGVNTRRDQRAAALAFLEEFEVSYPSIYNPDSRIAYRYGVRFMPATVVIDRQGRRAATIVGAVVNEVPLRRVLDEELTR